MNQALTSKSELPEGKSSPGFKVTYEGSKLWRKTNTTDAVDSHKNRFLVIHESKLKSVKRFNS